jgi:hypothetical protein
MAMKTLIKSAQSRAGNRLLIFLIHSSLLSSPAWAQFSLSIDTPPNGVFAKSLWITGKATGDQYFQNDATVLVSYRRDCDGKWYVGGGWGLTRTYFYATATTTYLKIDNGHAETGTDFDTWSAGDPGIASSEVDGSYTVFAVLREELDYGDQDLAASSVQIKLDATKPNVTFLDPAPGEFTTVFPRPMRGINTDPNGQDGCGGVAGASGLKLFFLSMRRLSDQKIWDGSAWSDGSWNCYCVTTISPTVDNQGNWNYTMPLAAVTNDDTYEIRAYADDAVLNVGDTTDFTFTVDSTPPYPPVISVPANGATISTLNSISGTAGDRPPGSGIQRVYATLQRVSDNQFWTGSGWGAETYYLADLAQGSPNVGWVVSSGLPNGLANGNYKVRAYAYDWAGNSSVSTNSFAVNIANPFVDFTSPPNLAAYSYFPSVYGTAKAASGHSIARVDLYIYWPSALAYWDGTTWDDQNTTVFHTSLSNGTNWTFTGTLPSGTNAPEDTYSLIAYAYDELGNYSALVYYFTIDQTQPPQPIFTFPVDGAALRTLRLVRGTATDNPGGSGLDHISLLIVRDSDGSYWSGTNWGSLFTGILGTTLSGTNWSRTSLMPAGTNLAEGSYSLRAVSYDRAGNYSSPLVVISNMIDQTPPVVAISVPSDVVPQTAIPLVQGNAADNTNGSGLSHIDVSIQRLSDSTYWSGTNWSTNPRLLAAGITGTNWICAAGLTNATDLSNGVYGVTATAYDGAGNNTNGSRFVTVHRNDNFADRIVLSGWPLSTAGANLGASSEPVEPNHDGIPGGKSIWWTWSTPTAGGVTMTTIGSDFDTVLAIYKGDSITTLSAVAGNDDDPFLPAGTRTSRVIFNAVSGTDYQIAVDGYHGASGNAVLNISRPILNLAQSSTNELIAWPVTELGFNLQSATNLGQLNGWSAVTNLPAVVNNFFQVTNVNSGSQMFYRLKYP